MKETLTLTFSRKMRFLCKKKAFATESKYHHNNNFFHFFSSKFLLLLFRKKVFALMQGREERKKRCNFCNARCNSKKTEMRTTKTESINCQKDIVFLSSFASHYCAEIKAKVFCCCAVAKGSESAAGGVFFLLLRPEIAEKHVDKSSSHSRILHKKKA